MRNGGLTFDFTSKIYKTLICIKCIATCISNCKLICILLDFSLTVKAATLIFISRRDSDISSAEEGKSGFIYNLVKSK